MAKNSCGCGCNSCNNGNNCNSCNSCASGFSSRGCGSLRYLGRSSYTGCTNSGAYSCRNNCNSCNNCNTCNGCNGCTGCNSCSARNAYTDYPGASTCAGYPLYYTGPCGCRPCSNNNCGCCDHHCCCHHCNNNCNNCCNNDCNNNCNNCCNDCCECCPCDNCCEPCQCCENTCSAAAEFIVIAPQHEYSGGAFTFASGACRSDGFELCSGGVRITRPGRYIAVYSFSAPACANAATTISFSLNGAEMIASRAFVSPALTGDSRAAMGQALFEADAGDIIALNTSTAMNIPASISGGPIATVIIYSVD